MSGTPPPPLRADVKIRKNHSQGETTYILKEPDSGSYYRFDAAQYLMLTLFDGRKDHDALVSAFDAASDEYAYDLEALASLIDSAREFKLLQRSKKEENIALLEKMKADRKGRMLQAQGSLMLMRFHLVDPNAAFEKIVGHLRWVWTPMTVKASLLLMGVAILVGISQASRFSEDFQEVFRFQAEGGWNFLKIWLVALTAIAFHETAHGLTCKNYGGDVDDMGFLLLAFQPCLYCNVNDAWMFENNRHKIYVAMAGIWIELVLAACAVFVWLVTDINNPVGRTAFMLVTISTAASLFMNLNPLLKYDGYYILSDWLQVPNLRQNAIDWFSHWLKTRLFRIQDETPLRPTRRERRIYLIYGSLTVTYLTILMSGLGFMLYDMVANSVGMAGIVLFLWLVAKLTKMLTGSWSKTLKELGMNALFKTTRRRLATAGGLAVFGVLLFAWSPQISIATKGKVDAQFLTMYAREGGFVTQVNYDAGRRLTVAPGQPLVTLRAPGLDLERARLLSRRQNQDLNRNRALTTGDRKLLQRMDIEARLVDEQMRALADRARYLTIAAPAGDWLVEGPPPVNLEGRYFGAGTTLLKLMPARQRHINVVLSQADLALVAEGNTALIQLRGDAPAILVGKVWRVTPVTRMDGNNRLFQVRIHLHIPDTMPSPPPDTEGEVKIYGEKVPLWLHILRPIRQGLRADLWI
ncbi:MAG: efflux RND transporter periplasmic adaptor subunit [Magnetococcus sp. DMHC-1]